MDGIRPLDPNASGLRPAWLRRFGPLQRRLALVAAIALVPLALLALANVIISAETQRDSVLKTAAETARAISGGIDADLAASEAAIETLTLNPHLDARNLRLFHAETRLLLERRPHWANITLNDALGQQRFNAVLDYGRPLPRSPVADMVAAAFRKNATVVGGIQFAPTSQQWVFSLHKPVTVGSSELLVMSVGIKPEALLAIIGRQRTETAAVITVIDDSGRIVARSHDQEAQVGKQASASLLALVANRDAGWGESTSLEGAPLVTVFQRSPLTQWVVAVGLPNEVVSGPVVRRYLLLGGGILASLALGLFAAFGASLAVSRPVHELGEAALAMGEGRQPRVPDTPLPEIRRVGEALADAHGERELLLARERDARRQAEEANRLKDEFLAMLGHELRNPLSAISNAAQILERAGEAHSDAGREAVGIIRRQSAHLALLNDELLDVARVMAGNVPMEQVPVNLAEAVQRTVDTFRATGRLERHRLSTDIAEAWVMADPTRLDQITSNLLTNAVKYTPQEGSIAVSVRQEAGRAVLEVSDSGVGMEPELANTVFELFVQGKRSLERAQGGLGVGLTLVQKLTHLLGGSVTAHSDGAWKGSRFCVRLPSIERPQQPRPAAAGIAAAGTDACKVVVVEDNEDARRSLRLLLSQDGHQVIEAADGPSGIAAILRERPDVALIDIGLPGADGYEVARQVRAQLGSRVRLVAVTGYGQPEDSRQSAAAGFDLYLVKPIELDSLARVLARPAKPGSAA